MRAPCTFPDEPEPQPRPAFGHPWLTFTVAGTVRTWTGTNWSTSYQPAVTRITWSRS